VIGRGDHLQGVMGPLPPDSTGRHPPAGRGRSACGSEQDRHLDGEGHEDGEPAQQGGEDESAGAH
jgi:hypothetical protein